MIVLLPTGVFEAAELLPPQPARFVVITANKTNARAIETRRACLRKMCRLRNIIRNPTPPIRARPNVLSCDGPTRGAGSRCAAATSVMMVNIELAVPFAAGVTLIGLNVQVVNCGRPEQEKLTA